MSDSGEKLSTVLKSMVGRADSNRRPLSRQGSTNQFLEYSHSRYAVCMVKIVDHLIRLGFVRPTPDPTDRMQINANDRHKLLAGIAVIVDGFTKTRKEDA